MKKVLCFDQSSKISAYSFWIDGEYKEVGVIDLSKIKDTEERVRTMGIELGNVIKQYCPNEVVIEEVAQQSNPKTLKILARIQGEIIGYCAANDINTYIITPSQWRSLLEFKIGAGVKRAELKKQAIAYIKENYGLELDDDRAEAICIGVAAHKKYKFTQDEIWD